MISSKDENVCHNVWSSLAFQKASGYPNISVVKRISDEDFRRYRNRIEVLAEIGAEDNIALCRESEADFWYFTNPSLCTAGLVLTHAGNLRAVWKGKDKSRIGVEFQGGKVSRYVIFKILFRRQTDPSCCWHRGTRSAKREDP